MQALRFLLTMIGVLVAGYMIFKKVADDTSVSRTDGLETTARTRRKDPPPSLA